MPRQQLSVCTPLLISLALFAGACTGNPDPDVPADERSQGDPCAGELGCVRVGADEPIEIGTLLSLSREEADVGQDAQNGAHLAADFLSPPGEILGHSIQWSDQDDECRPEGKNNWYELRWITTPSP